MFSPPGWMLGTRIVTHKMLQTCARQCLSLRRAALPLWRSFSEDPTKEVKDQSQQQQQQQSLRDPSSIVERLPGVPEPERGVYLGGPHLPEAPDTGADGQSGTQSLVGSTTHIEAPEEENKGEGGLITFLGTAEQEPKRDEVITFLGEKPDKESPDAAGIQPTFEVVMADQIPDRKLPFVIRTKEKRRPVPKPIDALKAVGEVQKHARAKFEESFEVHYKLLADPRRGDQLVRGAAVLPHGTGKKLRIAVFAEGDAARQAKEAGADLVGSVELINDVQTSGGSVLSKIDKCIATPDMMRHLGKLGRILGPKGLMPNPKLGTLTNNVSEALDEMRRGRVEFRADKTGVVHVSIGKVKFTKESLYQNFGVLSAEVMKCRPKGIKGSGITGYVDTVSLSSTMGPGIPVMPESILAAIQASRSAEAMG